VFFSLIGIIFFTIGCFILVSTVKFKEKAEVTDAVITDIEVDSYRGSNGKRQTSHDVFVKYTVDGEEYESEYGEYTSGMRVGQEVEVYYDPENPGDARTGSYFLPVIFMGIGGLFIVIGFAFVIVNFKSSRSRKKLVQNGDALSGKIIDVKMNTTLRINNRYPYKAECEVINPFDNEKYLYSSENITSDITELIGQDVTVYVDKKDRKKYYVDINELIEKHTSENKIHDYR
jgi:uncharacterized protein (UPF0333 family)